MSMRGPALAFLGPSLPGAAAPPGVVLLPPAGEGDIYRAVARHRPRALGIIDGWFEHRPAVWHKEILWAIEQGVEVHGAASMGALRAAELGPFGMIGHGRVHAGYVTGRFEADDAVAVVHAPAELGYRPLSDALVDIVFTLDAAVRAGVLPAVVRAALEAVATRLFFKERRWRRILAEARAARIGGSALDGFERWLEGHGASQKALDAAACLGALALPAHLAPRPTREPLSRTLYQRRAERRAIPAKALAAT